jgi:hypothetical protein
MIHGAILAVLILAGAYAVQRARKLTNEQTPGRESADGVARILESGVLTGEEAERVRRQLGRLIAR